MFILDQDKIYLSINTNNKELNKRIRYTDTMQNQLLNSVYCHHHGLDLTSVHQTSHLLHGTSRNLDPSTLQNLTYLTIHRSQNQF